MFYEGTEKRLEIIVKQVNLLSVPDDFWEALVAQAGALIISKIKGQSVNAYLLSESSLFIWHNRFLLITCGDTHLAKAAVFFQREYSNDHIQSLLFQRHQAIRPTLQKSTFSEDVCLLDTDKQGTTKHWGNEYQGDIFISGQLDKNALNTKQIVMLHGLSGAFSKQLQTGDIATHSIEEKLSLSHFFSQMLIDQFTFTPRGYSLNAISEKDYLTIHITPEKLSAYLSLESSFSLQRTQPFIDHLMRLFTPSKSQLISFAKNPNNSLAVSVRKLES